MNIYKYGEFVRPLWSIVVSTYMFSPQSTNRNPPNSLDFLYPFFSFVSPIQHHLTSLYKYHCFLLHLPSTQFSLKILCLPSKFQLASWLPTLYTWRYIDILATIWHLFILPCTSILLILSTLAQLFASHWTLTSHHFNMCYPTLLCYTIGISHFNCTILHIDQLTQTCTNNK